MFSKRTTEDNVSNTMYKMKLASLFWLAVRCVPLFSFNSLSQCTYWSNCHVQLWVKEQLQGFFSLSILYLVLMRREILNNEEMAKTMTCQTVGLLWSHWGSNRITQDSGLIFERGVSCDYLLQKFISLELICIFGDQQKLTLVGSRVNICQPWDCTKTGESTEITLFFKRNKWGM